MLILWSIHARTSYGSDNAFCTHFHCHCRWCRNAQGASQSTGWSDAKAQWVSLLIALGAALITIAVVIPLIKAKAVRDIKAGRVLESERTAANAAAAATAAASAATAGESNTSSSAAKVTSNSTAAAEATLLQDSSIDLNAWELLQQQHQQQHQQQQRASTRSAAVRDADTDSEVVVEVLAAAGTSVTENEAVKKCLQQYYVKVKTQLAKGTNYDIHAVVETDTLVHAMHARAEKFDPRVEVVFSYLQVFSAIAVIFAHGAGEVGYMAGPLNQIYDVVKTGHVSDESFKPKVWVLIISATSLVLGLATYGYNVMQAMGTMMCKLSPSRGFAAELATAMVIMIAAQFGLPTSSSQCITGGIMGKTHCSMIVSQQ
jgi:phosphate/sulfate permease